MAKNRKTSEFKKKRFMLELSPAEALGWGALLVFVCGWFFILGIFVGRGLVPVPGGNNTVAEYLAASENDAPAEPLKTVEEKPAAPAAEKTEAMPRQAASPAPADEPPVKAPAVEKEISVPDQSVPDQSFTIQVAALQEADFADKFFQKLKKQNYTPYIVKATVEDGIWYRLRCGRFANREEAEPVMERLRKDGYSPMLIQE